MRKNKTLTKVGLLSSTLLLSGIVGVINSDYDVTALLASQNTSNVSTKDTFVSETSRDYGNVDSKVESFSYDKQVAEVSKNEKLPLTNRTHTVVSGDTVYNISRKYGITEEQLRSWNGIGSDNKIQIGQVLKVGNASSSTAWQDSQRDPDSINNISSSPHYWKQKETLYRDASTEKTIESSKRYLAYGVNPATINISDTHMTFTGFAAQVNYTHTNYKNSDTYIVFEEANSNGTPVSGGNVEWFETEHVSSDISGPFRYNSAYGTPTLRCVDGNSNTFDTHPDWIRYGSERYTTVGCLHQFKDAAFKANITLSKLFGEGKDNIKYNMYVVNRTGKDRVLYAKIKTNIATKNPYNAPKTMGNVHFNKDKKNPQVSIHQSGYYWIKTAPNSNVENVYSTDTYFQSGWHNVLGIAASNTGDPGMLYYRLGTSYHTASLSFIGMPFVQYPENHAQLEYTVSAQKFNINKKYYSIEQGKDIKTISTNVVTIPVGGTHTISQPGTFWINSESYYPWGNQATTRKFGNPYPSDVNLRFVKGSPLKRNYRRNSDNAVVKSDTVWAKNGREMKEVAAEQFQHGSTWYLLDKAKSTQTQTRKFTEAYALNKKTLEDINWYYNSELSVKVRYLNENMSVLQSYDDKIPYRGSKTFTAPLQITVAGEVYLYRPHLTAEDKSDQDRNITRHSGELQHTIPNVDFVYDNEIPVRVNYYDTGGKLLQTKVVQVKANKTHTETVQRITVGGKNYRYQPSDTRNKGTSQSRTFAYKVENLADINFYLDEEIEVMINHAKYDYTENNTVFYSSPKFSLIPGETVPLSEQNAFGINNRVRHNALGSDYFFAGRGLNETGAYVKHPDSTHDLVDGNYKTPVKKTDKSFTITYFYMKEVKNPNTSEIDIKQNSKDPSNPNEVRPSTGPPMPTNNHTDYNGFMLGQTNWYLGKQPTVTSDNFGETIVNLSSVINSFEGVPLAVRDVNNSLRIVTGPTANYSSSDKYYNHKYVENRKVHQLIGEGRKPNLVSMTLDGYNSGNIRSTERISQDASINHVLSPSETKTHKGKSLTAEISYEYTNKLKDIYAPNDFYVINGTQRVFEWRYTGSEVVWNNFETYNLKTTATLDYDLGNQVELMPSEDPADLVVTQKIAEYHNFNTKNVATPYQSTLSVPMEETYNFVSLPNGMDMVTQRRIQLSGQFVYENPLRNTNTGNPIFRQPNDKKPAYNGSFVYNKVGGANKYYMADVDENYRDIASVDNDTGATMGKGSARVPKMTVPADNKHQVGVDIERQGLSSNTEILSVATNKKYVMGRDTGFIAEIDNYDNIERDYVNAYKAYFDTEPTDTDIPKLEDTHLVDTDFDWYYIPTDGNSSLKDGVTYKNNMYLEDLGLSQLNVQLVDEFKFEQYMLGSALDEVRFNVQKVPLKDEGYDNYTVINQETKDEIRNREFGSTDKKASSIRKANSKEWFNWLKDKMGW